VPPFPLIFTHPSSSNPFLVQSLKRFSVWTASLCEWKHMSISLSLILPLFLPLRPCLGVSFDKAVQHTSLFQPSTASREPGPSQDRHPLRYIPPMLVELVFLLFTPSPPFEKVRLYLCLMGRGEGPPLSLFFPFYPFPEPSPSKFFKISGPNPLSGMLCVLFPLLALRDGAVFITFFPVVSLLH